MASKPKLKRQCHTCKQVFVNPASWMKHFGGGGSCHPVSSFGFYGLVANKAGIWKVITNKRKDV